jgi:large subunit ribosomal protein L21e
MVTRMGGSRRKTRSKLKKSIANRGKLSITAFLQEFKDGDKVVLKADPSYQKGMYFPRFHGKVGVVMGRRGDSYKVDIKDFRRHKTLFVHPVHLKRL